MLCWLEKEDPKKVKTILKTNIIVTVSMNITKENGKLKGCQNLKER